MKLGIETVIHLNKFKPRDYQLPIIDALENKHYKKILAVMPRRSGKDLLAWNLMIRAALRTVGIYFYCLPTYRQAKLVIWDSITNTGERFLDYIPRELIASTNSQEMKIRLINGSLIQLIGSDTYDTSLIGTNPRMIVFSEWALSDPSAYSYVRPILNANDGTVIFLSTPRGKNSLWELYQIAQQSPEWFCYKLTLDDTQHISIHDIEREIASGEISRDLAQQEYFCFPESQSILTMDGVRSIKDIKPNDLIISHTGRFRKVIKTMKRDYRGDLVKIISYGSPEPIICTPNHPIRIYHKNNQTYEWKKAEDIQLEDRLTFPKLSLGKIPLISYELCMLIAWYICEGSSFKNGFQFSVGKQEEVDRILFLLSAFGLTGTIYPSKTSRAINIFVNSCHLGDFLKSHCGTHANNKRIPFSLISGREIEFFYELMKGDGCFSRHNNHEKFVFTTISKSLAYQVQLLSNSLPFNYAAGITIRSGKDVLFPHGKTYVCQDAYVVSIFIPAENSIEMHLVRTKYSIAARIKSIERIPFEGVVYNFSVQYDESYIVQGRAVHNCSFELGVEGSYYAKYIDRMRLKGQIGDVPWESGFKVFTAWDLGFRDHTAIIFFQVIGQTVRIIDCYENSKEGLEHYVKVVNNKPYVYAKHIAPHDIKVTEWGSGMSRIEKAKQLGISFTVAPDITIVDGIEAVRSAFSRIWIDEKSCAPLIKALENYRQEYDVKRKVYKDHPLHDWSSHFADCARYLCISLPKTKDGLSPQDIDRLRNEAIYGEHSQFPKPF